MQQVNTDSRVEVSTVSKNITHQTIRQLLMRQIVFWYDDFYHKYTFDNEFVLYQSWETKANKQSIHF